MGKSVVVSARAIRDLEKDIQRHDRVIAREQARRAETVKRLEAMRTLLGVPAAARAKAQRSDEAVGVRKAVAADKTVVRNAVTGAFVERPVPEVSVPQAVEEALKKRGPLTAVEIRDAVSEAGVKREKLGATYSYLYTVLGRLEQRRRISRVRGKYQLTPVNVSVEPKTGELKLVSASAAIPV